MSDHPPMPLADAERIAAEIVEWLRPVCDRIEVAGSVRRRKPEVRDIEIVCVPKIEETALDLFGQATDTRNLLDEMIAFTSGGGHSNDGSSYVWPRLDKNGRAAIGERYKRLMVGYEPRTYALDLFSVIAPAQWGVIMAIRTGPAEFSRRLVTRKSEGGLLPDDMLVADGRLHRVIPNYAGPMEELHTPEERDVFAALGIPWVEPEGRR